MDRTLVPTQNYFLLRSDCFSGSSGSSSVEMDWSRSNKTTLCGPRRQLSSQDNMVVIRISCSCSCEVLNSYSMQLDRLETAGHVCEPPHSVWFHTYTKIWLESYAKLSLS
ncbi:hypothetical protein ACP275_10G154900 [Erythranthe tilingii]